MERIFLESKVQPEYRNVNGERTAYAMMKDVGDVIGIPKSITIQNYAENAQVREGRIYETHRAEAP
jgi:hypothetical protein